MTTLFDSTRRVKPACRHFGIGLSRSLPRRERFTPSPADLAWAASELNAHTRTYDVLGSADSLIDQRAGEAAALDLMEAGCPAV